MNPKSLARAVQVLAAIGVWLPFMVGRALVDAQACATRTLGSALPLPTQLWLQLASNGATLLLPAACSALLLGLLWRRSAHGPWVTGLVLLLSTGVGVFGHLAAVLPGVPLCAIVS